MAGRTNLYERYELGEVLGKGGMGVVYRARDTLMDREVALKTLLDIDNPVTLELFYKECGILAGMVHPNIINVYDVGEFEDKGVKKPFFVMPLLPGATLDKLIRDPKPRFTLEVLIEIISQACRGLHAAHEMGLVHRDVKPSNIFVMDDNSVKIIDFGIARSTSMASMTSLKGTLSYMAPEQIQLKPPTPLSDQYSMAVVCYEALTRRRPFQGNTETEVAEGILRSTPAPISDLNPNVRYAISQVVHKAMARQPFHRFLNMREFSDALTRALRSETLEYFDVAKIKPRLERATTAFEQGDFEFAGEVLSELESEGYLEPDITLLRRRLDQSMRQTRVRQLLDSANRYAEAQEFPLALRKIQEALEIDPEHADALAMRNRVEKGRREKKVDEWIQLARQHITNQAFGQAREALDNALKVKPNDMDVLELLAEIAQAEDELTKTREKKAALYESAVKAWERGDVTSALSRLDHLLSLEKETPDTDSGRSGTYQKLYNQVRTEYDTLKNSYDEARQLLAKDDFAGANAICRQYLQRYPNHALFQSLQFDVEERQRQKLSALIAETDRRVDQEPDVDVRVAILEEAARQYPGEKHFQTSLRLMKDKRDLVHSIVAKAQFCEERQQFNEALDQWQILRTIHAPYPGLDFEIERVGRNRDAQTRLGTKARFIETIDHHIETAQYERARQEFDEALREFPNDTEFAELAKLITRSQERTKQAGDLFNRARELGEAGQVDDCLQLLRQAHEIDGRNPVIRTVLINTLLDRAGKLVNRDHAAAEPVLREVLELEPNQAAAQSLLNQVADRRREEFITQCATEARRLQVEGDCESALAKVRAGLEAYPHDKLLQQLQSTLQRALGMPEAPPEPSADTSSRQMPGASFARRAQTDIGRPAAAQQPHLDDAETAALSSFHTPAPIPPTATASYGEPTATLFQAAAGGEATALFNPPGAEPPAAPPPPPPPPLAAAANVFEPPAGGEATGLFSPPTAEPPAGPPAAPPVPPPTPEPPAALTPPPPQTPPAPPAKPKSAFPWKIAVAAVVAIVLIVAAALGIMRFRKRQPPSAPVGTEVPATPAAPAPTPRLPAVVIASNLNQATVAVDTGTDQPLQNGEILLPELAAGQRTIKFRGEGAQAVISVNSAPDTAPRVDLPIQQQNLGATIVSGLGGTAKVFTTLQNAEASLDGKPAGKIEATGLDLTNLTPGSHEIVVTAARGNPHRVVFDSSPVPSLAVFLGADRNLGMLRVTTGEDDVTVYINGVKTRRATQKGRLILNLEPNTYKVRVEKDGYQPIAEQTVEIKKGEEAKVDFQLVRLPSVGTVVVQKAPTGAEVLIDGTAAGTVHPDGTLSIVALKPGSHSLTVRKDSYRPLTREVNVIAGQRVEVDAVLQLATGTVKIALAPADVAATLSWKREGEEAARPFTENPLTLPEGSYTITGRAPDYEEARTIAKVVAGQQANAVLVFKRIGAKKEGTPKQGFSLADVEKIGGWDHENGSLTRTGGNVIVLPVGAAPGTYTFTAMMAKGKHLDWMINYVDARNYVAYELSSDNLSRTEYVDGKKQNAAKDKLQVKLDQWVQVTVEVAHNSIVTSITQPPGAHSPAIDRLTHEGPSLTPAMSLVRGKFAFRIPGKDRMALAAFTFSPK